MTQQNKVTTASSVTPQPAETETERLPGLVPFGNAEVSTRHADVYQDIQADHVLRVRWNKNTWQFDAANHVALQITCLSPGIVRFRYSHDGLFPADFSYAPDPDFLPDLPPARLEENEKEYVLSTDEFQIVILKEGMITKILDTSGQPLQEDAGGFTARRTVLRGLCEVRMEKKCQKKEIFLGLGDKTCGTNLTGKQYDNWNTDAYAFGSGSSHLYRTVPFYYSLHQGIACGIFFDNSYRSHFDFDSEKKGIVSFRAEGGEMNYYFLYGPSLEEVARRYAALTGKMELPPLWALGFHQCRWSYYPDSRVREVADTFRKLHIPCDALYLDIDYMDAYRCFTWDEKHFPQPKTLVDDLQKQGFQTVVMIDPGIKEDPQYDVYAEGMIKDHFVKTADGAVAKAPVWPGFCAFPDFTRPETRLWWGGLHRDLYNTIGISGFWNDMNEPAVFHVTHKTLPDDVRHHYDGHPCSHRKAHNIYGMQMTRASWEGFKRLQPAKRPYLLTRATYSGGQRYSAVWTGDNVGSWEHLQLANVQCQRLAISGFSFCGSDIGGFTGAESGELFVRWLQLGVFHPLMRVHSMGQHLSGDTLTIDDPDNPHPDATHADTVPLPAVTRRLDQEPWAFGEKWTPLAKKAIELRYYLLPCLYTAIQRAAADGTPVLRPLAFADPLDPRFWDHDRDFLFGEHLLVSPVVQSKTQVQNVCLPKNSDWYYFWSGHLHSGDVHVHVKPEEIPFFVRAGAVLPIYPVRRWTGESPVHELSLYVYYKEGTEKSHLYEDDGEGYAYRTDQYSMKTFETQGTPQSFILRQQCDEKGTYPPTYTKIKIFLIGFPLYVRQCQADSREIPVKEIRLRERSLYTLELAPDFREVIWKG